MTRNSGELIYLYWAEAVKKNVYQVSQLGVVATIRNLGPDKTNV